MKPLQLFGEALGHYQASGDALGSWQTLRFIGQTHLDLGDTPAARSVLAEAKEAAVALGHPRLLAQTDYWIGQAHLAAGDLGAAEVAFEIGQQSVRGCRKRRPGLCAPRIRRRSPPA